MLLSLAVTRSTGHFFKFPSSVIPSRAKKIRVRPRFQGRTFPKFRLKLSCRFRNRTRFRTQKSWSIRVSDFAGKRCLCPASVLGIGTTDPAVPLDIATQSAASGENLRLRGTSAEEGGQITFLDGTGAGGWEIDNSGADGAEQLRFFRDKGGEETGTKMVISVDGNVGIGTANPLAKMHIDGGGIRLSHPSVTTPTFFDVVSNGSTYWSSNLSPTDTIIDETKPQWRMALSQAQDIFSISRGAPGTTWSGVPLFRINSNGKVGIGTTNPSQKLHVVGNIFVDSTYDCTIGNASGSVSCSSDRRLKDNITPIPDALNKVLNLRGVEFDWNEKSNAYGHHDIGVIAQEVEKEFPSVVHDSKDTGMKMVDYGSLVAPLIQAVKEFYATWLTDKTEQDRRISSLESQNTSLKAENAQFRQELNDLKARMEQLEKAQNK